MGEDADQFATPQDHAGDGNDDLLGGGEIDTPAEDVTGFESSFPSMETQTQNEVWIGIVAPPLEVYSWIVVDKMHVARCPRWYHHRHWIPIPPNWIS